MEKEILTLENFDEKALELLKKENYDSLDIKIYYQPDEIELDSDTIRKIWSKKENIKAETFEEVLSEEIYNNWGVTDSFDISEEYIVNNVLKKYVEYPIESEEYEKITEKLYDEIHDNFNYDWGTEEVYESATVETLNIFIISNSEKRYLEDECLDVNIFTDYNNLEMNADILNSRLNSLAFLVQSQGYEVEDIYDEEKIRNSKFLSSLKNELDNNGDSYSNIVFTKANCNLAEAIHLYNSQENLIIPKEGIYCGFVDVVNGSGSVLEIELEKDITISKENFKVITDFGDREGYSVSELYNLDSKTPETFFKETKEKGFEQHEINIDNVLENAKKHFEIDNELDNNKVIVIR